MGRHSAFRFVRGAGWRCGLMIALLWAGVASAQYPNKPIRIVVGFPPGGSADAVTRILGEALSKSLAQPVVVDNRPGADSVIAAEIVMRAAPDGYTLLFASSNTLVAPMAMRKAPPYDSQAEFAPISQLGGATLFLYTHPALPARTVAEFIQYLRANPGKLNNGVPNSVALLSNRQLMSLSGTKMTEIPYKGEGPMLPDMVAGRLQASFISVSSALSMAADGRLRILAVALDQRSALVPDVPTFAEAGFPGLTVRHIAGIVGPKKLPRGVIDHVSREINAQLKRANIKDQFERQGYTVRGSTPAEFAAVVRENIETWKRIVRDTGIPLE